MRAFGVAVLLGIACGFGPAQGPTGDLVEQEFVLRALALAPSDSIVNTAPSEVSIQLAEWRAAEDWREREASLGVSFRRALLGRTTRAPRDGSFNYADLFQDPAPNVREAALELWLLAGPPPEGPLAQLALLEPLLGDPWPPVQELAVRALTRAPGTAVTARLAAVVEEARSPQLVRAASIALAERYVEGRVGPAELEVALVFEGADEEGADKESAAERYADVLRRLAKASPARLEWLTEHAWAADPRLEAALHALSLSGGGRGDLDRVVEHHFDAFLPPELRLEVAKRAARAAGPEGPVRYVEAAVRAARVERALRAGAVLDQPTPFDAGLAREVASQPESWAGTAARRLFEIALDAGPPEDVAGLALDRIDDPFALELLLTCLVDESVLFNAELVQRLAERARSRESLELLIDLYDAGAARGDGLARYALLELVEHGDPGVEGLAFRSLGRRLDTLAEAAVLHTRAFTDEDRAEQERRMAWLGGGIALEPFANDLVAIGMGNSEARDTAARLLARIEAGPDHARVLIVLERWLIEAQLAMSDEDPEAAERAEREAATRVGQLGSAGGEGVVESLMRSFEAARGRSTELGLGAVRALGATAAGRARLREQVLGGRPLEVEMQREAWIEVVGPRAGAGVGEMPAEWAGSAAPLARLGVDLLDGADAKQRSKLVAGLGRLGTEEAFEALLQLADGELELAAQGAIATLAEFESAVPELARLVRTGPSFERRLAALRGLRTIGSEVAVARLLELDAELADRADWGLGHPEERPLLADELRMALAGLGRLPEGALLQAWGEVLRTAAQDQLAALEQEPGERPSLRWRAPLAVLEGSIRSGEFAGWLATEAARPALAQASPEFLGAAVAASARGGDPQAVLALAEAEVAALAGLERPLELIAALERLADAHAAGGRGELEGPAVRRAIDVLGAEFAARR